MSNTRTTQTTTKTAKKQGVARTRPYATVVYPDSAASDWLDRLAANHVQAFVSPLHDRDFNADGTPKKPHWHVLLYFDGPKTVEQAEATFRTFGGVGREEVYSFVGYARYLCHLDNPEKAQYSPESVKSFCGGDYLALIGRPSDKYLAVQEMIDFVTENRITAYSTLLRYARSYRNDWFRVLVDSCTMVMREYIKSLTWECGQLCDAPAVRNAPELEPQSVDDTSNI